MSFTFNNLAGAVQTIQAQSVSGDLPVKVKLTTGSIVEIADIKFVKGDQIVAPETEQEPDFILIEL